MNEYKSIREWIAEGVNPAGYVDEDGRTVQRVALSDDGDYAWVGSIPMVSLDYLVAPPKPKRLSDEDLVDEFTSRMHNHWAICGDRTGNNKLRDLRTQILDRMKGRGDEQLLEDVEGALYKGPTRGEVETGLLSMLDYYERRRRGLLSEESYARAMDAFLSMFPEGEE